MGLTLTACSSNLFCLPGRGRLVSLVSILVAYTAGRVEYEVSTYMLIGLLVLRKVKENWLNFVAPFVKWKQKGLSVILSRRIIRSALIFILVYPWWRSVSAREVSWFGTPAGSVHSSLLYRAEHWITTVLGLVGAFNMVKKGLEAVVSSDGLADPEVGHYFHCCTVSYW